MTNETIKSFFNKLHLVFVRGANYSFHFSKNTNFKNLRHIYTIFTKETIATWFCKLILKLDDNYLLVTNLSRM